MITLSNVIISNYDMGGDEDDHEIFDAVSLSFEKIEIKYTVQADDHSSGDEHEVEYDVAAGA